MHRLFGHHLDNEGGHSGPFAVQEHFYPVGARDLERGVVADRDVAMPLRFIKERKFRFRFREHLFLVRREQPDPDREVAPAPGPFVDNRETMVQGRERGRLDALEKTHEAELAAHFLTNVVANKSIAQPRFDLRTSHECTLSHPSAARQSVFS